jgi:phosphocarrier protein
MIEAKFKITYSHGMHARPATMLVSKATSFESKMILEYNDIRVPLKSIMGVMSLAIPQNINFKITFEGPDEIAAFEAIQRTINEINQLK